MLYTYALLYCKHTTTYEYTYIYIYTFALYRYALLYCKHTTTYEYIYIYIYIASYDYMHRYVTAVVLVKAFRNIYMA